MPVSDPHKVPSIIDSRNGYLFQTTRELQENKPDLDEIMLETQAQLDKAVRLGLDIKYAEMHMAYGWVVDGLNEAFDSGCREKGIINGITREEALGRP